MEKLYIKKWVMVWTLVVLILIGFILVVLEFLVFPGVHVTGFIGFACIAFSIYLAYQSLGIKAGHTVVLITAVGGIVLTWYVLRAQTWKRLSLHSQIQSTVEGVDASIKPGDCGVSVGRLAPMGKVRVGEVVTEAMSQSGYIDPDCKVEVIKVYKDKIIVKLKTDEYGE